MKQQKNGEILNGSVVPQVNADIEMIEDIEKPQDPPSEKSEEDVMDTLTKMKGLSQAPIFFHSEHS
jgi:hypothetical protein